MNTRVAGAALGSVLVTGAEGQIARALLDALATPGNSLWGTTRRTASVGPRTRFLDLADTPDRWSLPPEPVDVAFLCAAIGSQDRCGTEPELTHRVNVLHTVALAERLVAQGAFVVFVSTNLVFDGETPAAKTDQPYNPLNAYGSQKAEAEQRLRALGDRVAIVRVGKVIAPRMALFDGWIENLRAGRTIQPFDNLVMAPISLRFATDVLCGVAAARRGGIVQATATQDISYARAAHIVAARVGVDERLIEPISGVFSSHVGVPRYATLEPTGLDALGLEAPAPERAFDHLGAA